MVKIIDYLQKQTEEGEPFFVLKLQGDLEIVRSENGNYYATKRKCSLASTFDEETCQSLIGSELEGRINKVKCEPYEYLNKKTGETIMLDYKYVYQAKKEESKDSISTATIHSLMDHTEMRQAV